MTDDTIDVLIFVNDVSETSISLEISTHIEDPDISQTVCSFFAPDAAAFGLDVISLNACSQLDPRAYVRLYNLLGERRPDVLHVHPNATGSIARILGRAAGVPHIVSTEHNTHGDFSLLKNIVNGSTNWLNDVVVSNSATTESSFRRWERFLIRVTGTDQTVIHNGVDLESVRRTRDAPRPVDLPSGFLVGTAARLVPQKNLSTLVEAASVVIAAHPDTHLIIVGDGPERASLERLATERGIADHTHFTGYLEKRSDVHRMMHDLDVYAFPSQYEGFGVAVAEAMAARCSVVANDIPVLREIVGDAGIYVDANDMDSFAVALSALHDDADRRTRLGEQASQRIESEFSIRTTAKQYAELYRILARGM